MFIAVRRVRASWSSIVAPSSSRRAAPSYGCMATTVITAMGAATVTTVTEAAVVVRGEARFTRLP